MLCIDGNDYLKIVDNICERAGRNCTVSKWKRLPEDTGGTGFKQVHRKFIFVNRLEGGLCKF